MVNSHNGSCHCFTVLSIDPGQNVMTSLLYPPFSQLRSFQVRADKIWSICLLVLQVWPLNSYIGSCIVPYYCYEKRRTPAQPAHTTGCYYTIIFGYFEAAKSKSAKNLDVILWFQGDRFGGALDGAARQFTEALDTGLIPMEFVNSMRKKGQLIMGIGHRVKSVCMHSSAWAARSSVVELLICGREC